MADYGTLQTHATAVLALLRAQPNLTVYPPETGGLSTVPEGASPPYVSVHVASDRPSGEKLDLRSTRMRVRIYCHCVGANDIAARAVSDKVADALLDVSPVINGRNCFPIRHEQSREPDPEEPIAHTTVTITEVYRLESVPGRDGS